jgi:hypothetical protein
MKKEMNNVGFHNKDLRINLPIYCQFPGKINRPRCRRWAIYFNSGYLLTCNASPTGPKSTVIIVIVAGEGDVGKHNPFIIAHLNNPLFWGYFLIKIEINDKKILFLITG